MVVSKDNKRKRNKSPVIESSPEMPKRTKVQAQRKFAQGQSAPISCLPSTSGIASSSQPAISTEPPTDLIPNKRPKTEDFLTFLCFRGTSALPAHLDFLNQNATASNVDSTNADDTEISSNKPDIKASGKTRTANASVKKKDSMEPSTSNKSMPDSKAKNSDISNKDESNTEVMTFPVRKRAGKFPEGNRKSNVRGKRSEIDDKSSRRSLRVRGKTGGDQTFSDQDDDKDDESIDEKLNVSNAKMMKMNTKKGEKNSKPNAEDKLQSSKKILENDVRKNLNESQKTTKGKRKSSKTPLVESDILESKQENVIGSNLKPNEVIKLETVLGNDNHSKDKPKRLRRESPIFVPTTESSGRMTRQRAFFEPVKVSANNDNINKDDDSGSENENSKLLNSQTKSKITKKGKKVVAKENTKLILPPKAKAKVTPKKDKPPAKDDSKCAIKTSPPLRTANKKQNNITAKETNKTTTEKETQKPAPAGKLVSTNPSPESPKKDTKSGMEIFEFSSDDEEPLAKSIQVKKKSPVKSSRQSDNKKNSLNKNEINTQIKTPEKEDKITNNNKATTTKSIDSVKKTDLDSTNEIKADIEMQKAPKTEPKDSNKTLGKSRANPATKAKTNKDESEDESLEHIREKVLAKKQQIVDLIEKDATMHTTKSETKTETKVETKVENKTETITETETKTEVKAETKIEAKIETKIETKIEIPKEVVEPEKRSSRPTRKTKEAATIYMGLIGEKLNSSYFEDDNISMDSFPDLPNVKETEKMETELKKNVGEKKAQLIKNEQIVLNQKTTEAKKIVGKSDANEKVKRKGRPAKKADKNAGKEVIKKEDKTSEEVVDADLTKQQEEDEDFLLSEEVKETKRKLENSFSDSDDEPLAIKVNKTSEKDLAISKKSEPLPVIMNNIIIDEPSNMLSITPTPVIPAELFSTSVNIENNTSNIKATIQMPVEIKTQQNKIEEIFSKNVIPQYPAMPSGQPKVKIQQMQQMQPVRYHAPPAQYTPPMDVYPTPKINPNFLTPKFDRNSGRGNLDPNFQTPKPLNAPSVLAAKVDTSQLLKPIAAPAPGVPSSSSAVTAAGPATSVAAVAKTATTSVDPLKDEIDSILAANLMPSKEESGKIFGIASVSLAQSSGPDNTKCTLGKCGSIHKPVLGPVVPTETHLAEQLTSKERRKAKVNMTHEQIQKWLIECSSSPDEIQDDFDDEYESGTPPPPLMLKDDKEMIALGLCFKTHKDFGKNEGSWSNKGPSLKATPISKDGYNKFEESFLFDSASVTGKEISISPVVVSKASSSSTKKKGSQSKTKQRNDTEETIVKPFVSMNVVSPTDILNISPKLDVKEQLVATLLNVATNNSQKTPSKKITVYNSTTTPVAAATTVACTSTEKKKAEGPNSFCAFSANNEKSIYSFDKEDDEIKPLSKSFRRQSQRESNAEEQSLVTLSPEDNMKMISVSLDLEAAVSGAMVDQPLTTELHLSDLGGIGDSDSEGQTFYIPLQSTGIGGATDGNSDTIQGVAVKLGREGPDGPNQKLIMHATLVTKGNMGSNTTPIPESMNVSEIVKNLLSNNCKDATIITNTATTLIAPPAAITSGTSLGLALNSIVNNQQPVACSSKSVPVGTVQPRFKSDQNQASGSGLQRVNSNSSLFSGSTKSRGPAASTSAPPKKSKDDIPIKMSNNTAFPHHDDPAQMVEAPVFRPTDKEFQDPIEFIERITPIAARFGICKIIPPSTFKPECRVSDDMRFTAYNQYVHKMLHRWGPSAKELSAIKKYLATQNIAMNHPPWIGGMEVDLPRLYHTVQELGGLKEVIEKKKWARVAEEMWIPKTAQDRVAKLDDIYCKYLLPYDILSPTERQKLFDEVEADWAKREARARRNADRFINTESVSNEDDDISSDDEEESEEEIDGVSMECIVKGRSMPLSQFFRIARNTMSLWFKNTEPTVTEIEAEFWRHVAVRDSHVCVHAGSIDSSGWGYGFPTPGPKGKGSSCARHPWNLKVLTNNSGSVLRSLGPVMGVTVPTLHVGMLFSACCWYRDPHGLSWIEYLHTGASKIWYGIPDDQSINFRAALTSLIPTHCQNKTIWLPCDTVMVPPHMLTDRGVSLCRTEQKPGEFVVIFPRAYTSSVSTGYVVSESVYFATNSWLELAKDDFRDIHDSCEPAMFSLEQLLFALASDQRVVVDILISILPLIGEVFDKEIAAREQLKAADVISTAKVQNEKGRNKNKNVTTEENECDLCRANLYISMVKTDDNNIYCLQHALKNLNKGNIQAKQCKLIYTYTIEDIENLIATIKDKIAQKKSTLSRKGTSQLK